MKFLVTESIQYVVEANDGSSAISARKKGDGRARPEHTSYRASLLDVLIVPVPISRDQWPIWAKAISQFSMPEDKGIGDVIARTIGDERSEKFKAWYLVTFGKPCGCNGRQNLWNIKYPLNLKAT